MCIYHLRRTTGLALPVGVVVDPSSVGVIVVGPVCIFNRFGCTSDEVGPIQPRFTAATCIRRIPSRQFGTRRIDIMVDCSLMMFLDGT